MLIGTGVMLGLSIPIAKAASAAGVPALAYALWPTALAALVLAGMATRRHGQLRPSLPLLRHERFSRLRLAAVAIGFSGAALLVLGRSESMDAASAAVLLVPLIPLFIGGGNVYRARHTPAGTPAEWLAAASLGASSAMLVLVGAAAGGLGFEVRADALGWLCAQALAMVVGYGMYFELIRRADSVTFSFMGYVMMLTGVAVGVGLFGERLPLVTGPALLLIVAAFLLIRRAARAGVSPRNTSATNP